tara:strand:- start:465 stop:1889 length:1425 start_codon:yes stop_codon:yes gene_type:complete
MPSWKKVIVSGSDAILNDITVSGNIANTSGDFTLDVVGDINFDANGADIILKDDGTAFGRFKRDSSDFVIKSETNNKDIVFRGQDGGSTITAMTIDMSEGGNVILGGNISGSATSTGSFGRLEVTANTISIGGTEIDQTDAQNLGNTSGTNTGDVTLSGTPDYITISNQVITRNQIDLANDVTGTLPVGNGGTGATSLTDGGVLLGSGTSAITATAVLTNGQLLIGDNSGDPTVATLTGTSNQVTVTNGGGSITLSTPQDLDTSADVTFDSVILDDLTATRLVATNGSKKLVSSDLNNWVAGTSNQISVADDSDGTITLSTPQNIHTSATPTFASLTTSGNVSGSAASTGSFGHLVVAKDAHIGEDLLADGDVVAYNSSDMRLKNNLQVIGGALDKIDGINGYEFDWNEQSPEWARERGHDVGVVAQEIQKIHPEIVEERKNGYLGVDYKRLVPLLIQSIKELKQEVEELKKKV